MAFSSASDLVERRSAYEAGNSALEFVVRVRKNGREFELDAEDVEQALNISGHWVRSDLIEYVEIFRVLPDGSLNPTIGPAAL